MAPSGRNMSQTCAGFRILRALISICIAMQGFSASKHRSPHGGNKNNQGALQPE